MNKVLSNLHIFIESYVRKHVNRSHNTTITATEIRAAQSTIVVSQMKKEWEMKHKQLKTVNTKSY